MEAVMHTEKPLISIVVPVYCVAEAFLRQCIESCLGQTYGNLELVLVDDGSPDQCGAVCDEYARKDSRVKVIHQKNQGVSGARNNGIAQCSGNWLTFLDADDYFESTTCREIVDAIEANRDLDLVIFSMVKDYEERQLPHNSLYEENRLIGPEEIVSLRNDVLVQQLDRNILRMTFCKAIRTDILREHGLCFDRKLPLCEDVVFWFHAVQFVQKAQYLDRHLYHYRQVSNSATDKYRPNVTREHQDLMQSLKAIIDETADPDRYLQGYCLEAFYSMQRIITQGYYHSDNPAGYFQRMTECRKALADPVYQNALKEIRTADLTRNHRIKLYLLKLRLYGAVASLRNIYGALTGRTTSEG